jgi:hypothetical protein
MRSRDMSARRRKEPPVRALFQDKIHKPTLINGSQDEFTPARMLFWAFTRVRRRPTTRGAARRIGVQATVPTIRSAWSIQRTSPPRPRAADQPRRRRARPTNPPRRQTTRSAPTKAPWLTRRAPPQCAPMPSSSCPTAASVACGNRSYSRAAAQRLRLCRSRP